ncbi:Uncharacterised protein [Anaerotruncus sp. 2789STDY5834896]|uniref:Minor capsid protein n=1 Tax=uncultured Anaerotruncus sp. TaxID=905011 RepID=A0A1C6I8W5_9FIRM|nr:Uncharacterised protein [uncultured Anaerotruncus sp.]
MSRAKRHLVVETPKGRIIKIGDTKCVLEWNPGFGPEHTVGFNRVQMYVDNEVLRLSTPYVPKRTGALIKSGLLGTDIGSGVVEYVAPYARYPYYGKLMVGEAPKRTTDQPLTYGRGSLRGPYWFERMKVDHKAKILAGARKLQGGDNGRL